MKPVDAGYVAVADPDPPEYCAGAWTGKAEYCEEYCEGAVYCDEFCD